MLAADARSDVLQLRSVRMHGERDALRARQQLEAGLSGFDSTALGLPSRAVLIVRRLGVHARLYIGRRHASREFARDVQLQLAESAQQARRPWRDADARRAEAVWFSDDSELMACLVRDLLRDAVGQAWWWASVLGTLSVREWLQRHVLSHGAVLAASLSRLAELGQASVWIARLTDSEARSGLQALERSYGLSSSEHARALSRAPQARETFAQHRSHSDRASPIRSAIAFERLLTLVPELSEFELPVFHRHLLVTALAAVRANGWIRTQGFFSALQAVAAGDAQSFRAHLSGAKTQWSPARRMDSPGMPDESPFQSKIAAEAHAVIVIEDAKASPAAPDSAQTLPEGTRSRASDSVAVEPLQAAAAVPKEDVSVVPPGPEAILLQSEAIAVARDRRAVESPPTVTTSFGGMFYLLNVALSLGLYGDFTQPRSPGLELSPWDWLALVARRSFGVRVRRDPLWLLLAEFSGRPVGQSPWGRFRPARDWTIPQDWFAPWDARELTRPRVSAGTGQTPRERWLGLLLSYIRARLGLALGVHPNCALRVLCRHSASIQAVPAAVDITLSLSALPICIRRAGLDRDPGWIPAAGRSVSFHFQ